MESSWIDYQQDEVHLMFEIGDMILDDLLLDTVTELQKVRSTAEKKDKAAPILDKVG